MPPQPTTTHRAVAALDLGSNSFHLIVAHLQDGKLKIVDRLREMVRLAAGLDKHRRLAPDAKERALACLERFGQRLRHMETINVRAVGTNTLRSAHDSAAFLADAERALGHPIDIISGVEEARLIYQGVAHSVADDGLRRLVMDIGGGSTEFIIGERAQPIDMESLYMGCVSMSKAHFNDGTITRKRLRNAELAALVELEPHVSHFSELGWQSAIGASGTIRAVDKVLQASGWSTQGITLPALKKLMDHMAKAGHIDNLNLPELSPERRPVFPGGAMILLAAFEALNIDCMQVSDGALREGLLYDLIGRIRHEDTRGHTVETLVKDYRLDAAQAQRVRQTALSFLDQLAGTWNLGQETYAQWLAWAAQVHEIGLSIAHSHYHKHGAYILENADLPGFSRQEQRVLAVLVRAHRRKFPAPVFQKLPASEHVALHYLAVILRLATVLHRSRSPNPLPTLKIQADKSNLELVFPDGWLDDHPLTREDLKQEAGNLKAAKVKLSYR